MGDLIRFLSSCELSSPRYFWIGSALLFLFFLPYWEKRDRGLRINLGYWERKIKLRSKRKWVLPLFIAITSFLMITALADPQIVSRQTVFIQGKPVMLVIDISGSMDVIPPGEEISYYEKAKQVVEYILNWDVGTDFGILLYSTENYIARYFTNKNELLRDTMENWGEVNYISAGTRTGSALENLRNFFFQKIEARDKAIIILSDLIEDFSTEGLVYVEEEMKKLRNMGVDIYVVVMAEEEEEEEVIKPPVEGVKYVSYYDDRGIDAILQEVAAMESSPLWQEVFTTRKSIAPLLIITAILLISVCIILSETRFRKIS